MDQMVPMPPMTVARVCKAHYLTYAVGIDPKTANKLRYHFNRWARITGDPDVRDITTETFSKFRSDSLEAEYSARSIETVITDVLTVLKRAKAVGLIAAVPEPGWRLKKGQPRTDQPTLTELAAMHSRADVAEWPCRVPEPFADRGAFWRAWIEVAYFTAQRLSDLLDFDWSQVIFDEGVVQVRQEKTDDPFRLPIHPLLRAALESAGPRPSGLVFDVPKSGSLYRRELKRMSEAAGVRVVTPQMIRRCAGTQAEKGSRGSGTLLLGRPVPGSDAFYFDREALLRPVVASMPIPPGWAPESDAKHECEESLLVTDFRRLPERDREIVLQMVGRLVR